MMLLKQEDRTLKGGYATHAIPYDKITTSTTITIYENSSIRDHRWYEEFEIDTKLFNDAYHKMNIDKCPILRKRK